MSNHVEGITQSYQEWCQQHPGWKLEGAEEREGFLLVRLRRPDGDLEVRCDNRPMAQGRYVCEEMVIDRYLEQDVPNFVAHQIALLVERCKKEQAE